MIFLTVGTQLPFDRFVEIVDQWAGENPHVEVFGQIGNGSYTPKHMKYCAFLDEKQYKAAFDKSSVVLAHAAMGSIITSLIASKPVVVFPRIAALGEHRNEHQLATCKHLASLKGCYITYDKDALVERLDSLEALNGGSLGPYADDQLMNSVEQFILADA